ncbi:MAG TPA: GIY-YIG nuclease family protein [Candidatus Paceibacterota bacterium]|nr:GIY-YIG nuclease family protein [Candidatus Paceibacterota bacterium]
MYFVYLLECGDQSIYTGITTDVERRFQEHQAGVGSAYTRSRKAVKMLYIEKYRTRSAAARRETAIKRLSRREKLVLISCNGGDSGRV